MSRGRSAALALLAWIAWSAPPAGAQQTQQAPSQATGESAAEAPAPPQPIPLAEIPDRADAVQARLRAVEEMLAPDPKVAEVESALTERKPVLERELADARRVLSETPSLRMLGDLESLWKGGRRRTDDWQEKLSARSSALSEQSEKLAELRAEWKATAKAAREAGAPALVRDRIAATVRALDDMRDRLRDRTNAVLEVQARLDAVRETIDGMIAEIDQARDERQGRLLEPDAPPLWTAVAERPEQAGLGAVREALARDLQRIGRYLAYNGPTIAVYLLVVAGAVAGAYALRRRSLRRRAESRGLGPSEALFDDPVSVAILATLPLALVLFPDAPRAIERLVGILVWLPALLVLRRLVPAGLRGPVYALGAFYVVDRARDIFDPAPWIERLAFVVEMAVATALVLWLLRPARLRGLAPGTRLPRFLGRGLRLAAVGFVLALLADLAGLVTFARLLGEGLLGSAYAGLTVFAVVSVLQLVAAGLMAAGFARRSAVLGPRAPDLLRRFDRIVAVGAVVLWVWVVLGLLSLQQPALDAAGRVLGTPLGVGSLHFAVGDVLLFAVSLWLAVWISRALAAVLEDEVLPRAHLGRGVPAAISTLAQYAVLLLGFLFAVGAAGIDFSKVALLAGALGVGIGFGLQNVVNNFISGLILLFERPIQVGDTIAKGSLFGEVKRIGIRSSTVRTWEGAEVIVPNGNLVAEEVVNWTLSDRNRRVDIPVGVAYGNDPARVIEVLIAAAQSNPDLLESPAPSALFTGFGDSSLDFELRAWTPHADRFIGIRSALAVAVWTALRDAGIQVPFPQRDLHLVSVAEDAARRLGDGRSQ